MESRKGSTFSEYPAARMTLRPEEFENFRNFLQSACGIALSENKQYLVTTRIRSILNDNKIDSLATLVEMMKQSSQSGLRSQVIDAMTTNETYWFRDNYPFLQLNDTILPELFASHKSDAIRIWSAACSSGQEPYSISMVVEQQQKARGGRLPRPVEIVGTDLSSRVLQHAKSAQYDKMSMARGLNAGQVEQFFDPLPTTGSWRVKKSISDRVSFKTLNLLDSYSSMGFFDVIYCRNVLIYFDAELKKQILLKLHKTLRPGGVLMLGASEGIAGASDVFEMVHANPGIFYRAR